MEKDWILLKSFGDPHSASLAQAMLEEQGIRVVSINKQDSSYGLFGQIEIYCHIDQAHRALDLIESEHDE